MGRWPTVSRKISKVPGNWCTVKSANYMEGAVDGLGIENRGLLQGEYFHRSARGDGLHNPAGSSCISTVLGVVFAAGYLHWWL